MPYQIDPHVDRQNMLRTHAPEQYYIEQLEARGGLIRIENIAVDAGQLIARAYRCDTCWCLRVKGDGTTRAAEKTYQGSCCTDLQVDVTPHELERLAELGRLADERLGFSSGDPLGRAVARLRRGEGLTERLENGELAFKHLRNGQCPLSWVRRDGVLLCVINSLCQALDLPLRDYKPEPCLAFPLHYVQYAPGEYLLTVIAEASYRSVGADAYVARLRCLSRPQADAPPAYVSLKDEIIFFLGPEFYDRLETLARQWLAAQNGRLA